jgi:hypothetical protein
MLHTTMNKFTQIWLISAFFLTFIMYKPPLRLQNLDIVSILMNFSFLCLHYMVVSVVYLFLDGTLSCFQHLTLISG